MRETLSFFHKLTISEAQPNIFKKKKFTTKKKFLKIFLDLIKMTTEIEELLKPLRLAVAEQVSPHFKKYFQQLKLKNLFSKG